MKCRRNTAHVQKNLKTNVLKKCETHKRMKNVTNRIIKRQVTRAVMFKHAQITEERKNKIICSHVLYIFFMLARKICTSMLELNNVLIIATAS